MQKLYAKQTLDDIYRKVNRLSNGCMIYPLNTTVKVLYNETPMYLIRAIFLNNSIPYKGKIIRSCKNKQCINPEHLLSLSDEDRFWFNVNINDDGDCWEWKPIAGSKRYGNANYNKIMYPAHRLAWELFHKQKIPEGMYVCHHCDNPPCCNPNHLFLGTRQDNVNDREQKGRNKMPHSLGEDHGHHKLTKQQVKDIRQLYDTGKFSYRKLAAIFPVSWEEIRNIVKRKTWSWI